MHEATDSPGSKTETKSSKLLVVYCKTQRPFPELNIPTKFWKPFRFSTCGALAESSCLHRSIWKQMPARACPTLFSVEMATSRSAWTSLSMRPLPASSAGQFCERYLFFFNYLYTSLFFKLIFKDVSREFDELQVFYLCSSCHIRHKVLCRVADDAKQNVTPLWHQPVLNISAHLFVLRMDIA